MQAYATSMPQIAAYAQPSERAAFIRRTYMHLGMAILAFAATEYYLLTQTDLARTMLKFIASGRMGWLSILGGFMVLGWMSRTFAYSASKGVQYFGLGVYVFAEAIIFLPLIAIAIAASGTTDTIQMAGLLTLLLFAGLTATVVFTKHDFSFLRSWLITGGFVALGLIVCGALFGFNLGLAFSGGMVIFASATILYDTDKILNRFPTDRHVGAALELFASVALLFWYVLRILIALTSRR